MPVFSVNTWSLEKLLGPLRMVEWREDRKEHALRVESRPEAVTLIELLAMLGDRGYGAVELSYAQFRETADESLEHIRLAARQAGVEMASLLLDYGDPSSADPVRRRADSLWYSRWIEIAAKAGFRRVRIPAGDGNPNDRAALSRAAEGLSAAAQYAAPLGVKVVTENLGSLLSTSANCLQMLELCKGAVGLTADFGNFKTDKYRQLGEVLPAAETVHAKAEAADGGGIDEADFRRCVELCADSGFKGPYSLTYLGGAADVWGMLDRMRAAVDDQWTKRLLSGYTGG